jgi:hypothetical protein
LRFGICWHLRSDDRFLAGLRLPPIVKCVPRGTQALLARSCSLRVERLSHRAALRLARRKLLEVSKPPSVRGVPSTLDLLFALAVRLKHKGGRKGRSGLLTVARVIATDGTRPWLSMGRAVLRLPCPDARQQASSPSGSQAESESPARSGDGNGMRIRGLPEAGANSLLPIHGSSRKVHAPARARPRGGHSHKRPVSGPCRIGQRKNDGGCCDAIATCP